MFGKVFPDLKTFDVDSGDSCFGASSYKRMNTDEKLFHLMKHLETSLRFQVNNFYYLKLAVDTKEIELEFSSYSERSINAQKFINHLSLRVFDVYDDDNEQNNARINRSIKLTLLENEMKVGCLI